MTKNAVSDWDTTPANNTDVGGVDLAENSMRPRDVNNAIRTMMAQIKAVLGLNTTAREVLTANRTYYVGFNIPTPTITIATPAVVSSTAHGMSAGAAVVFNVPQNTTAATSISAANPAVVTMTNTFAAGRPVVFASNGSLPIPIVEGTTYYVIATGLSGSSFQVSATVGGAAINTTPPTATFTNGSANIGITNANTYLRVGQRVRFATTGGLPTNFAVATDYYVVSASSTLITVSATNGGSAIVAGSAGTGTQTILQAGSHYVSTGGALPTGITEGTTYYVIAAGLTANAFEVSATPGGPAVNTTGSVPGSPIYGAYTGSDSNTGLANSAAAAFLSIQQAINTAVTLDFNGYTITCQVADGTYTGTTSVKAMTGQAALSNLVIQGNSGTPANVLISTTSANGFSAEYGAQALIKDLKVQTTTGGSGLYIGASGKIQWQNLVFGACADAHIIAFRGGFAICGGNYSITGGGARHLIGATRGIIEVSGKTITITGAPAFSSAFADANAADMQIYSNTWSGSATGKRYDATMNGTIQTFGAGATALPGNSSGTTATGGQYA